MRIRVIGSGRAAPARVNITPLIDVVMVLIIFYLIVGNLAAARRSAVDLPESAIGGETGQPDVLVLNVLGGAEGSARVEVEGVGVPPAALDALVRHRLDQRPGTVVQLRADRRLPFASVRPTVQACRRAGVTNLQLVTERGS